MSKDSTGIVERAVRGYYDDLRRIWGEGDFYDPKTVTFHFESAVATLHFDRVITARGIVVSGRHRGLEFELVDYERDLVFEVFSRLGNPRGLFNAVYISTWPGSERPLIDAGMTHHSATGTKTLYVGDIASARSALVDTNAKFIYAQFLQELMVCGPRLDSVSDSEADPKNTVKLTHGYSGPMAEVIEYAKRLDRALTDKH